MLVISKLCRKYVSLAEILHLFEDKLRNLKLIKFIFVKFKLLFFQLTGGSRNTKILLNMIDETPWTIQNLKKIP